MSELRVNQMLTGKALKPMQIINFNDREELHFHASVTLHLHC